MTVPKRRDGNHAVRQHLAPNSRKATVKPKGRSNLAKARCAYVHGLGQADRIMYRVECPGRQRLGVVFGGDNRLCLYHTELDFLFRHAIGCVGGAFELREAEPAFGREPGSREFQAVLSSASLLSSERSKEASPASDCDGDRLAALCRANLHDSAC